MLTHQALGGGGVLQPGKAVVTTLVIETRVGHLPGQPLPAVHPYLYGEGEPALEPDVYQAEHWMELVAIEKKAFAKRPSDFNPLRLAVPAYLECRTGLDSREKAHDAVLNALSLRNLSRALVLPLTPAREVDDRPVQRGDGADDGVLERRAHLQDVGGEVGKQDVARRQIGLHPLRRRQHSDRPAKEKTIES